MLSSHLLSRPWQSTEKTQIEFNIPLQKLRKKNGDGWIPHGWMEKGEVMTFWSMLSYLDIFNFLMFYPSELGSKDPSDYKNIEAYGYYKSG